MAESYDVKWSLAGFTKRKNKKINNLLSRKIT